MGVAEEVCGLVENPWMVGKESEIDRLWSRVNAAVESRNEVRSQEEEEVMEAAVEELKEARTQWLIGLAEENIPYF